MPPVAETTGMLRFAALLLLAPLAVAAAAPGFPPPKSLGPTETYGANLQRSMALMAGSTGLKRNTVRILFYGQSITAADWTKVVAERLRRQYPLTDFVIENRAIGGFSSEKLVHTAEADLYPFYPDLVILHDYGEMRFIEDIVGRLRERTTADILIATDHVAPLVGETMDEEANPLRLREPQPGVHDARWRSTIGLPVVAKKYGAELADVRVLWKQYLRDHKLKPNDLLYDDLHLNDHGNFLMAEIISAHLRHRPELAAHLDDRVKTITVGEDGDLQWKNGKLVLPFNGNKLELVCREGTGSAAAIRIDGRKPSDFPELYKFTRVRMKSPASPVPPLTEVRSEKPLVLEEWTLTLTDMTAKGRNFRFKLAGSVTGPDGEGESGKRFVSRSGRVVLEPECFDIPYALLATKEQNTTEAVFRWHVEPYFADTFTPPAQRNPFGDTVVVAAQGLTNGKHTLELTGGPDVPLAAIRIYRPPLR
jgi:hypothetical protein